MRIRTILAAAAVPAALAVTLLGATSASASAKPAAYSANAHESGVSDTTNVSGNATQDSPGGPVWALDNLERKLTATQNADGTWAVQISSQGTFSAFASPIDGNTWPGVGASASDNTGSVKGFVNYTVVSATPPSNANLPSQLPNTLHSADIAALWFGVPSSAVTGASPGGINYSFDYSPVPVPSDAGTPAAGISWGQGPNGLHYVQAG